MHRKEEVMSNVEYEYSEDGTTVYGRLMDGTVFMIDSDALNKIKNIKFYLPNNYIDFSTQVKHNC